MTVLPCAKSGGVASQGVALKHRLADASYRFLDRMRHKTAFDSAEQAGTAPDFAGLRDHKHALLVTFRRMAPPCRRPSGSRCWTTAVSS
jgi:hypothetical protein